MVRNDGPISDIIVGKEELIQHFKKLFPEVVKSNETGNIAKDSFALWESSRNEISIKLDTNLESENIEPKYDVYIGGPASICAAALQAISGNRKFVSKLMSLYD